MYGKTIKQYLFLIFYKIMRVLKCDSFSLVKVVCHTQHHSLVNEYEGFRGFYWIISKWRCYNSTSPTKLHIVLLVLKERAILFGCKVWWKRMK